MFNEQIVYVVDDDPAVRDSLGLLLKSAGINTVTYESAERFLDDFDPQCRGCLLVDVRMPGMSGLELQRALAQQDSQLYVLVMTGHGDVPMAVQAMKAGATEFIVKPFDDEMLLNRLNECLRHSADELETERTRQQRQDRLAALTAREREVLDLLVEGKPNKVVAAELNISPRTVEVHRARIMDKLEVGSLAELVRVALNPN